jgi:hypothetical protein
MLDKATILQAQNESFANDVYDLVRRDLYGIKCAKTCWNNLFARQLVIASLDRGEATIEQEQCMLGMINTARLSQPASILYDSSNNPIIWTP